MIHILCNIIATHFENERNVQKRMNHVIQDIKFAVDFKALSWVIDNNKIKILLGRDTGSAILKCKIGRVGQLG